MRTDQSLLQRGGALHIFFPPLLLETMSSGRRSKRPMVFRHFCHCPSPIGHRPSPRLPSCPSPLHTRWRRPVESRPRLGFAGADSLSLSPFGCQSPRAGGQGPGGDRDTCVAGPRARAQPAPPPPGPGPALSDPVPSFPVSSRSDPLSGLVCRSQLPKLKNSLQARLTVTLEMFRLLAPKQPTFQTATPSPLPRVFPPTHLRPWVSLG